MLCNCTTGAAPESLTTATFARVYLILTPPNRKTRLIAPIGLRLGLDVRSVRERFLT